MFPEITSVVYDPGMVNTRYKVKTSAWVWTVVIAVAVVGGGWIVRMSVPEIGAVAIPIFSPVAVLLGAILGAIGGSTLFPHGTDEKEIIKIANGANITEDTEVSGKNDAERAKNLLDDQAATKDCLTRWGWSFVVVGSGLGIGFSIPSPFG